MQIILAGFGLAACAFLLEWLEYKYIVYAFPGDVYILILVTGFTGLGIWVGHKISRSRGRADEFALNRKALAALNITRREYAVLIELTKGSSNKQIARDLGISPNTVKTHSTNLYAKLQVNSRIQAVVIAQNLQITPS